MNQPAPASRLQWLVWGAMAITVALIVGGFIRQRLARRPPPPPEIRFAVPPFTLTNQAGRAFNSADLRGQVWVADIVFTRCPGPCARMTRRMAELQAAIPSRQPVHFVTLTTDPEFDTPPVLEEYGRRFGADFARWHFLTGSKPQIAAAAVQGLKLTAVEKEPAKMENPNDLFIHSTIFVIVDKQGHVRSVIETEPVEDSGDESGAPAVTEPKTWVQQQALPVIERLLRE